MSNNSERTAQEGRTRVSIPGLQDERSVSMQFSPDAHAVVLQGDASCVLDELPTEAFRLIVTSPPYNIGKTYERQIALKHYLAEQEARIAQMIRLLAPDGSLCWQVGNFVDDGEIVPLDILFYPLFKAAGLKLRNRIMWRFEHGLHAKKRFSGRYETLLWFTKSDEYVFNLDPVRVPSKYPGKRGFKGKMKGVPTGNPKGKNPGDVWELMQAEWEEGAWAIPNVKSNHCEKTAHPCQFPIELVERCVLAFTNPGDWVLDPYGGVASAVIAAVKNDRRGTMVDRDPGFCAIALERIQRFYDGTLRVRPLGKPIHQPTGREKVSMTPPEWLTSGANGDSNEDCAVLFAPQRL
ncbi:MAG TPA: site-specific DNA-methyltransferase [Chthonomonadaceae bacterium]|nr:site-specific DNA-methyltransferase [Chthonomonadaceae bacterium]